MENPGFQFKPFKKKKTNKCFHISDLFPLPTATSCFIGRLFGDCVYIDQSNDIDMLSRMGNFGKDIVNLPSGGLECTREPIHFMTQHIYSMHKKWAKQQDSIDYEREQDQEESLPYKKKMMPPLPSDIKSVSETIEQNLISTNSSPVSVRTFTVEDTPMEFDPWLGTKQSDSAAFWGCTDDTDDASRMRIQPNSSEIVMSAERLVIMQSDDVEPSATVSRCGQIVRKETEKNEENDKPQQSSHEKRNEDNSKLQEIDSHISNAIQDEDKSKPEQIDSRISHEKVSRKRQHSDSNSSQEKQNSVNFCIDKLVSNVVSDNQEASIMSLGNSSSEITGNYVSKCQVEIMENQCLVYDTDDSEVDCEKPQADQALLKTDPYPMLKHLILFLEEAFFLSYGLGVLVVYDSSDRPLNITEMWNAFIKIDSRFPYRYAVYHNYRSKAWVPKPGLKFGADFVLYKYGPAFYHASYSVIVKTVKDSDLESCRSSSSWSTLSCINRVTERVVKELLFCYVIVPDDIDLISPACLTSFKIMDVIVRRWISKKERQMEQSNLENDESVFF